MADGNRLLGRIAVERGLLTAQQMDQALARQEIQGRPLADILIEDGYVTSKQLENLFGEVSAVFQATLKLKPKGPEGENLPEEVSAASRNPKNDLGKFVLVKLLGRGGMGEAWKAWDKEVRRFVAVKFIRAASEEDWQRLVREAQVAAKLEHPSIVPVYDVRESDRGHYIVMKFVDGSTLDRANLTLEQKLMAIRDAALAIDFAHQQGVVHRDIKPQNIMIEDPGAGSPTSKKAPTQRSAKGDPVKVYVMDFGLAKQMSVESSLSVSGVVIGTPAYMPPEQARGRSKEVDPRSDVYSLGATLYQIVAGVPPFQGEGPMTVIEKVVLQDPIPIRRFFPGVPRDIETIAQKCLEKDKERRYASAKDVADDLQRYLDGEAISARPVSMIYRARRLASRHKPLVAMGAITLAVAGYFAFSFLWPATVWIESDPSGAEILVDDRSTGLHTPARLTLWPPGRHVVKLEKKGFEAAPAEVVAGGGGSARVAARMTRTSGHLSVVTAPEGAEVLLESGGESRSLGKSPLTDVEVERGVHRVILRLARFETVVDAVDIRPESRAKIEKTLTPEIGTLDIQGNVNGMSVRIESVDGQDFDPRELFLPARHLSVPAGRYRLNFDADGCFPRAREIVVEKDRTCGVLGTLNPRVIWRAELDGPVRGIGLADLDGDGLLDAVAGFVVLGGRSRGATVALSGKDGSRIWASEEATSTSPSFSDTNGDGILDCLYAGHRGLVLNGKDGTRLWGYQGTINREQFAVADLNRDGIPDLISRVGATIQATSGKDHSTLWIFTPPTGLSVSSLVRVGDINGDQVSDSVAILQDPAGKSQGVAISGRDGSTLWKVSVPPRAAIAGPDDLNGDKTPDIVVRSTHALSALSCKDGTILWEANTEALSSVTLGDMDGDGRSECVITTGAALAVLEGLGGKKLWQVEVVDSRTINTRIQVGALGDLDGDGTLDCLVHHRDQQPRESRLIAISGRSHAKIWDFNVEDQSSWAVGDVNRDGALDCVVGSGSRVFALSGKDGPIIWESRSPGVRVEDLDGDGIGEFVVTEPTQYRVLSGRSGDPIASLKAPLPISPRFVGDLNGDGVADCVVDDKGLKAFSGRDGKLLWELKFEERPFRQSKWVDLDGDGLADLLFGSANSNVYAHSGKNGAALWEFGAGGPVDSIAAVDVDADGKADVIVSARKLYALSGRNGSRLWECEASGILNSDSADLNLDGRPDLLCWAGHELRAVSGKDGSVLWRFASPIVMQDRQRQRTDPAPIQSVSSPADLNGDGIPDCVASVQRETLLAVSGKDGSILWTFGNRGDSRQVLAGAPFLADIDGDGSAECYVVSAGNFLELSGKTGLPVECYSKVFGYQIHHIQALGGRGAIGWFSAQFGGGSSMRAVELRPSRRVPIPGMSDLEQVQEAVRGAILVDLCGGETVESFCTRRLKAETDSLARHYLFAVRAKHLLDPRSRETPEAALQAVQEWRREGGDTFAIHAVTFLARKRGEDLAASLRKDPEGTVEFLMQQAARWRNQVRFSPAFFQALAGSDEMSRRVRAGAYLLSGDYDLAFEEINAARRLTQLEKLRKLESFLPKSSSEYCQMAEARFKEGAFERAAGLAEMAVARSGRDQWGCKSALVAAKANAKLKRQALALEYAQAAIDKGDPRYPEVAEAKRLLKQLREGEY
jgi:outer membrane protein assembly factor BamB